MLTNFQQRIRQESHDPKHLLALAAGEGVEVLGMGRHRLVFVDPGSDAQVIKMSWDDSGLVANQLEWRLYQRSTPSLRQLLCPCIDLAESGYLIQARCLPIKAEMSGKAGQLVCQQLARYGISDCAVNLGLYTEKGNSDESERWRTVCYDYSMLSVSLSQQLLGSDSER